MKRTRIVRFWLLAALLTALVLGSQREASAQGQESEYWRYAASGRLQSAELADVNADGIDEVLVVDENGRVALISADGQVLWSHTSIESVAAATRGNFDGSTDGRQEIAIGGDNWLALLSATGDLLWQIPYEAEPTRSSQPTTRREEGSVLTTKTDTVALDHIDIDRNGTEEILALLSSGRLLAYDRNGRVVWEYMAQSDQEIDVDPQMLVADFDRDGWRDIVLGLFTPRRFSQLSFVSNGEEQWTQSISRRITSLVEAPFTADESYLAVGTNFGQLDLYDAEGNLLWFRTVNRPITAMAFAELRERPVIAVGTDAGSVVAYAADGRREWTNNLDSEGSRALRALLPTASRTSAGQASLVAILEGATNSSDLSDVLLLGNNGQTLLRLGDTDLPNVTQLVDVNRDGHHELLLARFASLELVGLGVGNSEYVEEWEYVLDAAPTAWLVIDLDKDGEDEVIVGTRDGRLHTLGSDQSIRWLHAPGNEILFLDTLRDPLGDTPRIVVVRHEPGPLTDATDQGTSWLELRSAQGERLWELSFPGRVTAMVVDESAEIGSPAVTVGTSDGRLLGVNSAGEIVQEFAAPELEGGPSQLLLFADSTTGTEQLLIALGTQLLLLDQAGDELQLVEFHQFPADVVTIFDVQQPGSDELSVRLVAFIADGTAHGLSQRGIEMSQWPWPQRLPGRPTEIISSSQGSVEAFQENTIAYLIATVGNRLLQLTVADNQPLIPWTLDNLNGVTAMVWDDLNKDGRPDTALVGTEEGRVLLYDQLQSREPNLALELDLASTVTALSLMRRSSSQSPDLLTVAENSVIRLFREEENRPPLLTNPEVSIDGDQIGATIFVKDVENDNVSVRLELWDPTSRSWMPQAEQQITAGNGPAFWSSVQPVEGTERLEYRFRFDDGFYRGYVTPAIGPLIPATNALLNLTPLLGVMLGIAAVAAAIVYVRQSTSPTTQANRFYRRLTQEPATTLRQVEQEYMEVDGSPDFLLQLANRARQAGDDSLASLADGFFLLANRPQAGLSIIIRTLDHPDDMSAVWETREGRLRLYRTAQALLEAPSITEVTLLRPQLVELLAEIEAQHDWSPVFGSLLPILTNMRDSVRVDGVDDRIVYLNQAAVRLRQLQEELPEFSPRVERTMAKAIIRRWSGLITAEIEELKGRAELEISLKTKRVVPNGATDVAMVIRNSGRAPAENIVAALDINPAYEIFSPPQTISFLPSGRSRQIQFQVVPKVRDRFRVALSLTYDDRNHQDKTAAFGDMVHLLPPEREFKPISNPYLPGTPLRRDSALFFGREELFEFIAESTGTQSRRNVLMLVGQRRTGKTSALLRLNEHLPPELVPVYIDCQSLGVTPGMAALLEELAWQVSDTLQALDIQCDVPEHEAWGPDPTRYFERTFLPLARSLLPTGTTLLLVFDEFEAFETMVDDGILPRTFFTYMRHLMQHSEGLSFIFVGTHRLEEMSSDYWSVLFNIALYRKIDYLSDPAATRLICEPVAPSIIYDDLAVDKILRVTAGHPYFLQLVCYTLVKRANHDGTGYVTISDVNAALDEMLRLGEVHFAYLWQRSDYTERALLTAAAQLMDRNEPLYTEELIDYLQGYGIDLDPATATEGLNSLVTREIMREINEEGATLYEFRVGLVGLWVGQNKSLSRLHAHLES